MDFTKLQLEKELESQQKLDSDLIFQSFLSDSSKAVGENTSKAVANIRMKNIPAYFFKVEYQMLEREFYDGIRAVRSGDQELAAKQKSSVKDYSFDDFEIKDVSFYKNSICKYEIKKTIKIKQCPSCKGEKTGDCPVCRGEGKKPCRRCKGNKYIVCPDCEGKKGKYNSNGDWIYCKKCESSIRRGIIPCPVCHGDGKVRCSNCNGKGIVECQDCEGKGKVTTFIGVKDSYHAEGSSEPYFLYHTSVPENLKNILEKRKIPLKTEESVIDLEDTPENIISALNTSEYLSEIRSHIENEISQNNQDNSKIIKIRTQVYQ